ncbi:FecCD family ABC transporter permease [Paenibacillus thalictri]|uniref:Iron ABC transporter permease n=1 Tax=Paenibacillus thalictri TaxID=2527873 RepID=A0A4Q9DN11_9BACL|nr:iron ABC transporter permease [Paenibacillus thalictri]TBL74588.1 iron ABC transporter permease [Paenibacillus thalictri]
MMRSIVFRSKTGRLSFHAKSGTLLLIVLLLLLTAAVMLIGAGLGNKLISPLDVFKTAAGYGTAEQWLIVGVLRLPRIIVAALVGAAMGVSGAILQGTIRNPLASPDIMGITGGAACAAVAFIAYFSGKVSITWLPVAAFIGAGAIAVLIYALAWRQGVTPIRLVLVGIGISAITSAATTFMIMLSPIKAAGQAYIWLTGSVYGASWAQVLALLPWVAICIPLAFVCARNVSVQELGDDVAQGLGAAVQRQRCLLLILSVALAGSAVAVAGAIGFIGLIAPHMARKLAGASFAAVIPVVALLGSLLAVAADTVARTLFLPHDIPAGVFTAGIGAPFFIYLLYKNRNR